ncbi:MAG: cupredoxin domain-containing protein [Longimonas sp.]|uniref:cupredoxin domain-containing protein n=1 Tax=Longimonas sp. TaxID=2039626 RepID=UPI00334C1800
MLRLLLALIAMLIRLISPALILSLALFLAACGSDDPSAEDRAQPTGQNDVPTVEIAVHNDGYEPAHIQLESGTTTRLIFTRKGESPCIEKVTIPDLGVDPVELPMNEPVAIEVTPESDGEFTFTCGMDMVGGTLMVQS